MARQGARAERLWRWAWCSCHGQLAAIDELAGERNPVREAAVRWGRRATCPSLRLSTLWPRWIVTALDVLSIGELRDGRHVGSEHSRAIMLGLRARIHHVPSPCASGKH